MRSFNFSNTVSYNAHAFQQSLDYLITSIDANNKPWWIAKEVCQILELTNVSNALPILDLD